MATGSTLPRRLLAKQLRELRAKAGVSAEVARNEIGVSKQTLWRMENGLPVKLNPLFIRRLCEIYNVAPERNRVLLTLAEEAKAKGWWHAFDDALPKAFGLFVGLEDAAHHIVSYQTTFLPGLLHTPDYRRALIWTEYPNMPTDEVEQAVEIATQRQARLSNIENPVTMEVLIDESVLRRVTGSPAVMADQLGHLAEVAELPNVSVRVVPSSAGTYRGLMVGTFVLLEFPPHPTAYLTEPPVVYVQGFTGDLYLEKPDEVALYRGACTDVKRVALGDAESRALVLELVEEYAA
ncbi:helix-turn-helix domain-containing protein [Nocardia nova]|uniref:helix-turn-helix domain-containing protein n=1 Tax=Nocardia nova TaxID=37330 RepID=UPI0033E92E63